MNPLPSWFCNINFSDNNECLGCQLFSWFYWLVSHDSFPPLTLWLLLAGRGRDLKTCCYCAKFGSICICKNISGYTAVGTYCVLFHWAPQFHPRLWDWVVNRRITQLITVVQPCSKTKQITQWELRHFVCEDFSAHRFTDSVTQKPDSRLWVTHMNLSE